MLETRLPGVNHWLSNTAAMQWQVGGTMYCARNEEKKPGWITLRLKKGPLSATRTHCLCRQANSGHHCDLSSMYLLHTRRKTRCSLGIFLPVIFSKEDACAWFGCDARPCPALPQAPTAHCI